MTATLIARTEGEDGSTALTVRLTADAGRDGSVSETRRLRLRTVDCPALAVGDALDGEALAALDRAAARCEALTAALRLLAYGDNATPALVRKLRLRHFDADAIAFAVERVTAMGYIDDAAILDDAVLRSANEKLYGARRITAEMRAKGFDSDAIAAALDRAAPRIPTERNKRLLLRRRFGHSSPETREEAAKMKALLYRYGY